VRNFQPRPPHELQGGWLDGRACFMLSIIKTMTLRLYAATV